MNEPKNKQAERNRMLHARQVAAQAAKQSHQAALPDRQPEEKSAKAVSRGRPLGQSNTPEAGRKAKEKGAER